MKLSVIIPAYNAEDSIETSVQSVLDSLSDDSEILVIDDGSIDQTANVIRKSLLNYPQVRLLHHPGKKNLGVARAIQVVLKLYFN